jgi:K+-transporting ATPase KdpF subunit
MTAGDAFLLLVSVALLAYLFYALVRGENL